MEFYDELYSCSPICVIPAKIPENHLKNIEDSTNKKLLLEKFQYMPKIFPAMPQQIQCFLETFKNNGIEDGLNADLVYHPDRDVELKIENLVNITTLTNSIDRILTGKFLLGRCIADPIKVASIGILLEDPEGQLAMRVLVHNTQNLVEYLSTGKILAIVDPHLRYLSDGSLALRVTNCNSIITFSEEEASARFPDVTWHYVNTDQVASIRKEGNRLFLAGKYKDAIFKYTEGLGQNPNDEDILSNRSLSYIRTKNFAEAVKDASLVLNNKPLHVKAIHRVAQAHIGLKEYDEAKGILESKLKLDLPKKDLRKLLARTEELIAQRDFGKYDMAKFYASRREPVTHEIADYVGPVEVADVGVKGRGLLATEDIEPGHLLVCIQAIGSHWCFVAQHFDEQNMVTEKLTKEIAKKIYECPELGKEFYKLSAGKKMGYLDPSTDNYQVVDKDRILAIVEGNTLKREDKILSPGTLYQRGVWILPSYINHDCVDSNCSISIYGNVCQVISCRPIKKGEELLRFYPSNRATYSKRVDFFKSPQMDFVCECRLCQFESKDPKESRQKRDRVIQILLENMRNLSPQGLKTLISEVIKLSNNFPFIDYYLADPYIILFMFYVEMEMFEEAVKCFEEHYNNKDGFCGDAVDVLHSASSFVYKYYLDLKPKDLEKENKWKTEFLNHVKLAFGCSDFALIDSVYGGNFKKISD